jgi:hypothetical protein
MNVAYELLTATNREEYEEFLGTVPNSMIYSTASYRDFLHSVLMNTESTYFLARVAGRIAGAIPVFWYSCDGKTIGNSLPYFGSHGDVMLAPGLEDATAIEEGLLDRLLTEATARRASALNLVTHLFRERYGVFEARGLACVDQRTGQISELPAGADPESTQQLILSRCHQKTRNSIRKALAANFQIEVSNDLPAWQELHRLHSLGMERVGGQSKSWAQFEALKNHFDVQRASKLYVARKDGAFAGGLLVLFYGVWAEYFVPVSNETYRSDQVLSAIILQAMVDAAVEGRRYWNWGGTWPSQEGVYRFKSRWGAEDYPYSYYGQVYDSELLTMSAAEIERRFPSFYVRRFN